MSLKHFLYCQAGILPLVPHGKTLDLMSCKRKTEPATVLEWI